jgi:hypothetical protein
MVLCTSLTNSSSQVIYTGISRPLYVPEKDCLAVMTYKGHPGRTGLRGIPKVTSLELPVQRDGVERPPQFQTDAEDTECLDEDGTTWRRLNV